MAPIDTLRQTVIERALLLAQLAADTTVAMTQAGAPRRTGNLVEGISHDQPVYQEPYIVTTITSAAPYSEYQNVGTGIYGPSGARIFPTTAKALRFDWPAAGGIVFAKSVAGSPGTHFFDRIVDYWPAAVFENAGAFAE